MCVKFNVTFFREYEAKKKYKIMNRLKYNNNCDLIFNVIICLNIFIYLYIEEVYKFFYPSTIFIFVSIFLRLSLSFYDAHHPRIQLSANFWVAKVITLYCNSVLHVRLTSLTRTSLGFVRFKCSIIYVLRWDKFNRSFIINYYFEIIILKYKFLKNMSTLIIFFFFFFAHNILK